MTNTIFLDAINISIIGMGFVVAFLVLFLFSTQIMSAIIVRLQKKQEDKKKVISEEASFVIKNAVQQHLKNV